MINRNFPTPNHNLDVGFIIFQTTPLNQSTHLRQNYLNAISKDELKNIKFPLLPESIQSTISAKLRQSFLDRQKSLELLTVAKGAVEVAVEDGEDVALGYIDNNL